MKPETLEDAREVIDDLLLAIESQRALVNQLKRCAELNELAIRRAYKWMEANK